MFQETDLFTPSQIKNWKVAVEKLKNFQRKIFDDDIQKIIEFIENSWSISMPIRLMDTNDKVKAKKLLVKTLESVEACIYESSLYGFKAPDHWKKEKKGKAVESLEALKKEINGIVNRSKVV